MKLSLYAIKVGSFLYLVTDYHWSVMAQ